MNHEAIAAVPPVAVASITLLGVHLHDWVLGATLVYTVLLIVGWIWDRVKRGKE
jgi:disulfide bond formation protein DsbB